MILEGISGYRWNNTKSGILPRIWLDFPPLELTWVTINNPRFIQKLCWMWIEPNKTTKKNWDPEVQNVIFKWSIIKTIHRFFLATLHHITNLTDFTVATPASDVTKAQLMMKALWKALQEVLNSLSSHWLHQNYSQRARFHWSWLNCIAQHTRSCLHSPKCKNGVHSPCYLFSSNVDLYYFCFCSQKVFKFCAQASEIWLEWPCTSPESMTHMVHNPCASVCSEVIICSYCEAPSHW